MNLVHLDEDPYIGGEFDDADIVVTKYETGSYCGSGDALALRGGNVEYWNLGHCSCYGPFDGGPDETMSLDDFKKQNESAACSWPDDVAAKFLELVAAVAV